MQARARLNVLALALACCLSLFPPQLPRLDCLEIVDGHWAARYARCSVEYLWRGDPKLGIRAARAALYHGDHDAAARVAGSLVSGPCVADAEYVLGAAALAHGKLDEARAHLERALAMHERAGKLAEKARDAHQLAGVWFKLGEYRKALDAMDVLRASAPGARDPRMVVYADLGRADIHRAIGDQRRAEEEIQRAVHNARHPDDRLQARFKQGIVQLEAGHHGLARQSFEQVLADGALTPEQHARFLSAARNNLIELDLKQGQPAEALQRLQARWVPPDALFWVYRGLALAGLGRLAEAREDLRRAEAARPQGEESWWVPYQAALVETKAGRTDAAIDACRRSIAKVTDLAGKSGTYGPKVIAAHRQPHFHLIGLYAAQRRWADVLEVVATLDAHALIDSREASADLARTPDAPPVLPAPARGQLGDASAVAGAWRGRQLVVVVPGGGRAWRLVLRDGALEGRDLGDLARLEKLAETLARHPCHAAAGRELGEALLADLPVGARAGAPEARSIDLLVVGPLAGVALASLRLGDRLAIAQLRLARVPGVLPRIAPAAPPAATAPRAVVLGDPRRDLPASAEEAARLAVRLGADARIGADATRAAFHAASGADLLHVSAHTKLDAGRAALVLADGELAAADVGRLAPAPRLVVLASCAAAAGTADDGSGSLAHAFLDAGAAHVVATKWTIRDAEAARLVAAFYDAGGERDPIQGLAAAQQQLAGALDAHTWASFEVLAARPATR